MRNKKNKIVDWITLRFSAVRVGAIMVGCMVKSIFLVVFMSLGGSGLEMRRIVMRCMFDDAASVEVELYAKVG